MTDKKREAYETEKAKEVEQLNDKFYSSCQAKIEANKDFIRTLLNEAPKPKVSREWVEDVISRLHHERVKDTRRTVNYVLSALKVEVEK